MKNILFDLDGTLVDSSPGIKAAFRYAFNKLQLSIPSDQALTSLIGPPLETTFANILTNEKDVPEAITFFREYYNAKGVHQVSLYADIVNLLQQLKRKQGHLFVTTSKYEPMALLMLEELNVTHYFDAIYGSQPQRFKKGDILKACLKEQSLSKSESVIIGDTKFDIVGGKSANIKTLGITWGFGLEKDLKLSGADAICHQPLDIIKTLKSL